MTVQASASLPAQRHLLRAQLGAQRLQLTGQIAVAGAPRDVFPRSVTMRWLLQEPELVTRLIERTAGRRAAAAVPAILLLTRFLRTAAE